LLTLYLGFWGFGEQYVTERSTLREEGKGGRGEERRKGGRENIEAEKEGEIERKMKKAVESRAA